MRIKIKNILFTLGIIAVVRPGYLIDTVTYYSSLFDLYFVLCFGALILILIRHFTASDAKRISKILIPVILYCWLLTVTYMKDGEVKIAFYRLILYSYSLLLAVVCCKYNAEDFIRCFRNVLFVLILVNMISVLAFPSGLYGDRNWFLGYKNGIGKYGIMLITVSCFTQTISKHKIDKMITLISVAASVITSALISSASGLVGCVLPYVVMLYVTATKQKKYDIARMRNYFAVIVFVFCTVVLTQTLLTNPWVEYFITKILHKTIMLSGRLVIWENVMKVVHQNLLIGIGTRTAEYNVMLFGGIRAASDAHNFYLEFMVEGGLVAVALQILMFIQMTRILDQYRVYKEISVLAGGLFTMMLIFITENTTITLLWIFFGICLSVETYIDQKNHSLNLRTKLLELKTDFRK